jgi:hypothetical protein
MLVVGVGGAVAAVAYGLLVLDMWQTYRSPVVNIVWHLLPKLAWPGFAAGVVVTGLPWFVERGSEQPG